MLNTSTLYYVLIDSYYFYAKNRITSRPFLCYCLLCMVINTFFARVQREEYQAKENKE